MNEAKLTNPAEHQTPPAATDRCQSVVSILMLALFLLTFVTADLLARTDAVSVWFGRRELAHNQQRGEIFVQRGAFFDDADYLWNQKLDKDDYSHGGVYLIGSSAALHSLDDWGLPADQQRLIHNYAYSAITPPQMAQFAEFLIDDRGILSAGPGKTLFIIGLDYADMVPFDSFKTYFAESLKRSGVYEWKPDTGIVEVSQNPAINFIKTERARTRSFVLRCLGGEWHIHPSPLDPEKFRQDNVKRMGDQWQPAMAASLSQLSSLLDELNKKHVPAVGLILPEGTWNTDLPMHDEYLANTRTLFASKGVDVVDAEHSVPDGEFYDAVHCNEAGTARIQGIIMNIALDFLHKTGAL